MTILVATQNSHKIKEMSCALGPSFTLMGMDALSNPPMIEEMGSIFQDNAKIKVTALFPFTTWPILGEDSGLEVGALNGNPGVLSKRYGGEPSSGEKNIAKLLEQLKDVPLEKRSARFISVVAFSFNEKSQDIHLFKGELEGWIAFEPRGVGGFGYDPIFCPLGFSGKTMAELSLVEKSKASHRGKAMDALKGFLSQS